MLISHIQTLVPVPFYKVEYFLLLAEKTSKLYIICTFTVLNENQSSVTIIGTTS